MRWCGVWGLAVLVLAAAGCDVLSGPGLELEIVPSVVAGKPPLAVRFRAELGLPAAGTVSYLWEFGDGASGQGQVSSHLYTQAGTFTARLLATDALGNVGRAQRTIRLVDFGRRTLAAPEGLGAASIVDLNRDGAPDLVTLGSAQGRGSLTVFLNQGAGHFPSPRTVFIEKLPVDVASADFDANGVPDLAVTDLVNSVVLVLLGRGNGAFHDPARAPVFRENVLVASGPHALAVGDFNGDGAPDVATANQTTDNVSVLLGGGDGTLRVEHGFSPHRIGDLADVSVGDFDRDGLDDLALLNRTSGQVEVYLSRGDGTFLFHLEFATGEAPTDLVVRDLDGDGFADLLIGNGGSRDVSVWWGRSGALFSFPGRWPAAGSVEHLAVADVDGDGRADLLTLDGARGAVGVLLRAERAFEAPFDFELGVPAVDFAPEDLDGDGRADLAVTHPQGRVNLLFNTTP